MARQRGNKWQADVIVNGQRQRPTFNTRLEAEAYEASCKPAHLTVGTAFPMIARELWGGTKDERNCLRIADELVSILGPAQQLSTISDPDVEKVTQSLRLKRNKPRTMNTKLTRLSALLKKAKRKGWVSSLPTIDLFKVKGGRIRFLTPDEEAKIRSHLPEHMRGLFDFLLYTGCRWGEAHKLTWADANEKTVTFWDTKSGKPRTIPLTSQARAGIPWTRHNELIRPFAFVAYETFYHAFVKARKDAGLGSDRQVVIHTLRHTCASRLVQRGVDMRRVRDWLGHSSIEMTMRYAHLAPDDLYLAVDALEGSGQTANLVPQALAQ